MKKNRAIIGVLLLVFVLSIVNIYKGIRNDRYDELRGIEVNLGDSDYTIEPSVYKYGFDFNYGALPVIEVEDDDSILFFDLVDDNINEIIVYEDYYAGNTCYKETYTLKKTTQGKFELPIKSGVNNREGEHATYYIKYNLKDEGVFVFNADFLFNTYS